MSTSPILHLLVSDPQFSSMQFSTGILPSKVLIQIIYITTCDFVEEEMIKAASSSIRLSERVNRKTVFSLLCASREVNNMTMWVLAQDLNIPIHDNGW